MADEEINTANPDNQNEEDSDVKQKEEDTVPEPNLEQEPELEPLESDQEILNRIFMGEFENLPPQASKLVRIFTSSTFTDTGTERNMLMENIYPKIKDYCRERGLEFQVVDMRWGVRDESTDDHKTADLCMQEIDNCQRLSLGPNFVVFLGQKYGYRPLPTRVLDKEFLMITDVLEKENAELLFKWYKLDTNSVPNIYVLQPISSIYKNYTNKLQKVLQEQDQSAWWRTMNELCTIIRMGSARLMQQNKFSNDDNHRYNYSVTEQEVVRGLLTPKDNIEHCLAFIREIKNINIKLFVHSSKFVDINFAAKKIDDEAQKMLSLLRDVKVHEKLHADNIIPYSIEWSDNEGINKVDHNAYLKDFSNTFYLRIVDLIDRAISKQSKLAQNKVFSEILQHLLFCNSSSKLFRGRNEILEKIELYVKNEDRNQPFVMNGPSGCGKSSILAKIALEIKTWIKSNCTPVIVIRFLGTTPDSSSIYPLLKNICHQISHNYQKPIENIPLELSNLTNYFKSLLKCADAEKPLFIILDSLDSLSAMNSAHSLSWLPVNLPKHVKIILSTLTGYYGIVETLHNMIEIPENFAQVEPLGEDLALIVVFEMLKNMQRTINDNQLSVIKEVLNNKTGCNSPLYVKLLVDQVLLWKSYTTNTIVGKSIEDCVEKLFERVENAHGKILVKHALAYITASKNGLSESELEDLISLDEHVLNDIYQYHLPPIRRIPPLLWTRIRNDISSYLTEREADGISVVSWYHRQFFQGIWANFPKPYSYTEEQKKMFLLQSLHGEADRKVPAQPEIFFNPNNNTVRYNGRKLSELPFNLIRSNRFDELYSKVLFNYKFLYAKLSFMPLNSLIADFEDCLSNYKQDKEVILVLDALRLASSLLSASATNLAPQIIGRLLPYRFINSKRFDNVRYLLDNCETDGLENSAFVPAFNCFHSPGGPLVYSLEAHPFGVYGISLICHGTQLLSVSNKFIIFDLSSGDVVRVINPQVEGILQALAVSPDKKYCVSYSNNDQIVVCNIVIDDVKLLTRHLLPSDELRISKKLALTQPVTQVQPKKVAPSNPPNPSIPQESTKTGGKKNLKSKEVVASKKDSKKEQEQQQQQLETPVNIEEALPKKEETPAVEVSSIVTESIFPDQLIGCHAGLSYFVIWSKYYYYVYDKKGKIIKAELLKFPIIQIEIIENKSIEMYGIELEIVKRTHDCKDDDELEREEFLLEYQLVLDESKVPKKSSLDFNVIYISSCFTSLEFHSCLVLTKNKSKLFTCTEIGDNVIQCYKKRKDIFNLSKEKPTKYIWKFNRSLDDNLQKVMNLVLSEDENYMLAIVTWGYKVIYLLTGQSKPIRLPNGVKNIQIGAKKLTYPAVFSKNNKYVVAGVRDNIYIWETSYGTYLKQLDAHYGRITCCLGSFDEQKNLILSSSMDKTIKIWNLNNIMEEDFHLDRLEKPIERLHVSISACIAMAQSRNQLEVYNLQDGRIKFQLCHSPHGAIFNNSVLSTTGSFAASSESNKLIIWNVEEKEAKFTGNSPKHMVQIKQLKFHQSDMCLLCATVDTGPSGLVTIINYMVPDGEDIYQIEYNLKAGTEFKEFIITNDDKYLVIYRNDKKNDVLAIYLASDGTFAHNFKLTYLYYNSSFISMVPMHKNPQNIAIIDQDRGNLINVRDKKFLKSIPKWNGHATKDDKFGLYAPSRGGLELIDLKNGKQVKILIPKIAEGVFDVSTLITPNDRHVIYYHSGRRTIRVFRLEDGKKIADYKSTARVRCMKCTQDSKSVIIGCEDGSISMFIIADAFYPDYFNYLTQWRADQMGLYSRNAAPSPVHNGPPPSNFTTLFKCINILAQKFDAIGNAPPTPSPEPIEETVENNENENQNTDELPNNEESNQLQVDSASVQENPGHLENNTEVVEDNVIQDTQKHYDDDQDVIIPLNNKIIEQTNQNENNKEST